MSSKAALYSGIVWTISAFSLVAYCIMVLLHTAVPGVEELVASLALVEEKYIYIAAFVSIFIEGLYVAGSFFPGSTLVIILAILSQVAGVAVFLGTILTIFIGWCLAGAINILFAKMYRLKIARLQEDAEYTVADFLWTTWFPSFRANYEVAQVTEGGSPMKVFLSSVRVKFWASIAAALYALVVPLFIDINMISNKEGLVSVVVVAAISFIVGVVKLRQYYAQK